MNIIESIIKKLDLTKGVLDPVNLAVLKPLSLKMQEEVALQSKMMVLYFWEEVQHVRNIEENSAMKALPHFDLKLLNVLNVGAGNRPIHSSFISIEAFRE